jgi:hypothetical protein
LVTERASRVGAPIAVANRCHPGPILPDEDDIRAVEVVFGEKGHQHRPVVDKLGIDDISRMKATVDPSGETVG